MKTFQDFSPYNGPYGHQTDCFQEQFASTHFDFNISILDRTSFNVIENLHPSENV